jgi:hypothetical protein
METEISYEVVVGNIGNVYTGKIGGALETYETYKKQSSEGYGRAAHEDVIIVEKKLGDGFMSNYIIKEYNGYCGTETLPY